MTKIGKDGFPVLPASAFLGVPEIEDEKTLALLSRQALHAEYPENADYALDADEEAFIDAQAQAFALLTPEEIAAYEAYLDSLPEPTPEEQAYADWYDDPITRAYGLS